MKIHSSSLTSSRIGFNRQRAIKSDEAQHKVETFGRTAKNQAQPSSPEEISKVLSVADSAQNGFTHIEPPTDIKTLKALNAYTQELNQPLQDRTSQLITGIDTYA